MNIESLFNETIETDSRVIVQNEFPKAEFTDARIAIIGEAPGKDEEQQKRPFVGASGYVLDKTLQNLKIPRAGCFVGNICQIRPPNNKIEKFLWEGPEIQSGLAQLRKDLQQFKPNVCVLLGKTALKAALGQDKILNYRGTLFLCQDPTSPMFGFKCMATIHPAAILRMYKWKTLFTFDMARIRDEAKSPVLVLPDRNLVTVIGAYECIQRLNAIRDGDLISMDIEGRLSTGVKCISFATSPTEVFICDFMSFSVEDEGKVWQAIDRMCYNEKIGKILQNGMYDQFVLAYGYGVLIRGIVHDTMLSGWEIYPELPKSLGTQTSIWTREPFYKDDADHTKGSVPKDWDTFLRYCCKDSAVTYEIALRHQKVFASNPSQKKHFDFNMRMLPPLMYSQLRGIRYNKALAEERHAQELIKISEIDSRIMARLGHSLNPDSPKATCIALYDELNFPVQHPKKEDGPGLDTTKRTSDAGALLKLARILRDPFTFDILSWRHHSGRKSDLELVPDTDGRTRGTYNVVGTVTGRLAASKSATGNGMNLQTVTYDLRDLFIADEGKWMWQCDLAGADGWTVAAECKSLRDPTMWDDYIFGLKPAKILVLLYRHGSVVNTWSREKLQSEGKDISEKGADGWLYFACKRVQHGTNYLLGIETMSNQILEDSYKKLGTPIYVQEKDCQRLQKLYLSRYYGVPYWQNKVRNQIVAEGKLSCASGHVRRFFGRTNDHDTYRQATAHVPQANTTFVTNCAIDKLYRDPENRCSYWKGKTPKNETEERLVTYSRQGGIPELVVEPLHQIHDAALGQFDKGITDWSRAKIKTYFDNPIIVAGITFVIPYDGHYGPNWKDQQYQI